MKWIVALLMVIHLPAQAAMIRYSSDDVYLVEVGPNNEDIAHKAVATWTMDLETNQAPHFSLQSDLYSATMVSTGSWSQDPPKPYSEGSSWWPTPFAVEFLVAFDRLHGAPSSLVTPISIWFENSSFDGFYWAESVVAYVNFATETTGLYGAYGNFDAEHIPAPVPEPSTIALLGLALAAFAWKRRKT